MKNVIVCFLLPIAALFCFALVGCRQDGPGAEKAFISPPFPSLDPAFTVFRADATKEQTFVLPHGGHLKVPKGAFVDAQGNAVTGEVTLRYREFHNAADIFLSGIPMKYDSAGNRQLETAGMFELRGSQNDKEVFVKKGASLEVRLASFAPENDYMAYALDENARNWRFLAYNRGESNAEKIKLRQKVAALQLKITFPMGSKYFALDYRAVLDVFYNNDLRNVDHETMQSKLTAYGLGWLNVNNYSTIKWKGKDELAIFMVWRRLGGTHYPDWILSSAAKLDGAAKKKTINANIYTENEAVFRHQGGDRYLLTLYNPKMRSDSFNLKVEAVMTIADLFKFPPEYWEKNYKQAMALLEQERERMATVADMFRTLEISGFGIYNYDRLLKMDPVEVAASFQFESQWAEQGSLVETVYLIPGTERSVVKLERSLWPKLPLIDDPEAHIMVPLSGNRLAVFSAEKYAAIDFDKLRKTPNSALLFELKTLPEAIVSADQVRSKFMR